MKCSIILINSKHLTLKINIKRNLNIWTALKKIILKKKYIYIYTPIKFSLKSKYILSNLERLHSTYFQKGNSKLIM